MGIIYNYAYPSIWNGMWVLMDLKNEAGRPINEDEDIYWQDVDFFGNDYMTHGLGWWQMYPWFSTLPYIQAFCNVYL